MNLANVDAIHAFLDAVAACKGEVYLKSREGMFSTSSPPYPST